MCEFCTKHGEGRKWYLQMKNYSQVLLHEQLSEPQKEFAHAGSRYEWNQRFFESFMVPACAAAPRPAAGEGGHPNDASHEEEPHDEAPPPTPLTEEQILSQKKAVHFGQVLPIEDVDQVIDLASSITRMPCGCRFESTGLCDKRYCFGLGVDLHGILGRYPEASASLEVLDKQEARRILYRFDDEGLIHSIWTGVTPYVIGLCNCDHDCEAYKGYIEQRGIPSFFRAEYVGQVDWDQCSGCKECMSQCQFGAQFYSSALGKVYIDPLRCFGCGVCRAACPNNAIALIPRQSSPAADVWLREPSRAAVPGA